MAEFNFHFGVRKPQLKGWVVYSVSTAVAISLIVTYGNKLLSSRHGEFFKDAICSISRVFPEGQWGRLFGTLCRTAKTGKVDPDDARKILGRTQQLTSKGNQYFDNDWQNTDAHAEDEVDFAFEEWKRANPLPKIDTSLRKQFPSFTEEQLCVLTQAERYVDENAVGIRYVGMSTCEEDEVKSSFEASRN